MVTGPRHTRSILAPAVAHVTRDRVHRHFAHESNERQVKQPPHPSTPLPSTRPSRRPLGHTLAAPAASEARLPREQLGSRGLQRVAQRRVELEPARRLACPNTLDHGRNQ
mgnify:CR=1 FL=1